ncbi:hypothetical protein J6590_061505 [Homalodisca vitripennis]|nr:hypothetical protein J6590_061505 [Homalodisca vitripennis]
MPPLRSRIVCDQCIIVFYATSTGTVLYILQGLSLAIFIVVDEMFHDTFCDTRCTDFYLDARRLDVCRGTRYVNACDITLPTLFYSGHL